MKKTNKKVVTIASMVFAASVATPVLVQMVSNEAEAATTVAPTNFKDIDKHWGKTAIQQALAKGFVNGYENGTFKPDNNITRIEFTTILSRAIPTDLRIAHSFKDIPEKYWGLDSINKGIALGFINPADYSGGKFNPDAVMSREEISQWLAKGLSLSNPEYASMEKTIRESSLTLLPVTEFLKGGIAKKSIGNVGLMIGTGLMVGDTNGNFNVSKNITRAEIATVIMRFVDVAKKAPTSFTALNEIDEVSRTGTNFTTLTPFSSVEGKSFQDMFGKSVKYGSEGTGTLERVIAVDTRTATPKGVYANMFRHPYTPQNRYSLYAELTFTPAKITNFYKIANTGVGGLYNGMEIDATLGNKYDYKSPDSSKNEFTSNTYLKVGQKNNYWMIQSVNATKGSTYSYAIDINNSYFYRNK